MTSSTIISPWRQYKDQLQERWSKLTDEDMDAIPWNRDELVNLLQHRYGFERDAAEKDADEFLNGIA